MKILQTFCPLKIEGGMILGRDGTVLAGPSGINDLSPAEHAQIACDIVSACNAHEKLAAAIRAVQGEMGKRISRSAFDEFSARTKALLDETFVLINTRK